MAGVRIADPPAWLEVEEDGVVVDLAGTTPAEADRRLVTVQLWRDGWRPLVFPELSDPSASELGPFARASETSRQAALDAYPRQGSQRWAIIQALRNERPATRDELETRLGLGGNTIRPRVRELIAGGWLEELEFTRRTRSGSQAKVLKLTGKAELALRER